MATMRRTPRRIDSSLRTFIHAAHHQRHRVHGAGPDGLEGLLDLHGQFARGQNDERLRSQSFHLLRIRLLQHFHDGNEETEGLAGSGLRRGQHIAAFERGRNCPGLHRRGDFELVGFEPGHQSVGK